MIFVPPSHHEYNPHNLPDKMNFLKATKDLPLPLGARNRYQIYISKLNKQQVKEIIVNLEGLMMEKLASARVEYRRGHIVIPGKIVEEERRKLIQEAIYTKAVKDFTEKYLASLEMQHKI